MQHGLVQIRLLSVCTIHSPQQTGCHTARALTLAAHDSSFKLRIPQHRRTWNQPLMPALIMCAAHQVGLRRLVEYFPDYLFKHLVHARNMLSIIVCVWRSVQLIQEQHPRLYITFFSLFLILGRKKSLTFHGITMFDYKLNIFNFVNFI